MTYIRKNVYSPTGNLWEPDILWYAKAVQAMKQKSISDQTSWKFYGAIHGIDPNLWNADGYPTGPAINPPPNMQSTFWQQCQHSTWYFLPWHRGYILAIEAILRAWVTANGGPADWALPYWNYFNPGQNKLPAEFAAATLPDGTANPLFVTQRYGPDGDGNVYVPMSPDPNAPDLDAMNDTVFTGAGGGASPGFGGPVTKFHHIGNLPPGGIEAQPHNSVHGLVGGQSQANDPATGQPTTGLMSDPDTAALDPIFWLHHANIDRLWEVWRLNPATNVDPTDADWLGGPKATGGRAFIMPNPDSTAWTYTPADMTNFASLNYTYDDLSPQGAAPAPAARLASLGMIAPSAVTLQGAAAMKTGNNVELVGASVQSVSLAGTQAKSSVVLDRTVRRKVGMSLTPSDSTPAPDRVFLNLENIRGSSDSEVFAVYVGLPEGAVPAEHPECRAGSVSLFGVTSASNPDGVHGGQGLTHVLEITKIVDALHLKNALDVDSLDVLLVPRNPVRENAQIRIGRISIFRQGL